MNLFSRSYEPGETIIEPGKTVTSLMFITKGHIAVCEPSKNEEPICILQRGNYFGDFHILKHVPCFFAIKAVKAGDFTVNQNVNGNT
jgi:CRP-like cAMP-binding protein